MPAIQVMTSTPVLPLGNYANGTRTFGPVDVASDVTSLDFSLARCTSVAPTTWPNVTTEVEIIPEVSLDNEVTWIECGRFKAAGGIVIGRTGAEVAFSMGGGYIPPQVGAVVRRFRGTTIVTGGPIRTAMTLEVN